MTDTITIPPEAVEAAAKAIGEETYVGNKQTLRDAATAAIHAALAAWPGAAICHYTIADNEGYEMVLPIPFPQENPDDQ